MYTAAERPECDLALKFICYPAQDSMMPTMDKHSLQNLKAQLYHCSTEIQATQPYAQKWPARNDQHQFFTNWNTKKGGSRLSRLKGVIFTTLIFTH